MDTEIVGMIFYKALIKGPKTHHIWTRAICRIPINKTATYTRICVIFSPKKLDLYRVRIIVGGNLLYTLGDFSPKSADMTISKIL